MNPRAVLAFLGLFFAAVVIVQLGVRASHDVVVPSLDSHRTSSNPQRPAPTTKPKSDWEKPMESEAASGTTHISSWSSKKCLAGAELDHPKLHAKCQRGEVAKAFCKMMRKSQQSAGGEEVPCGQFSSGVFSLNDKDEPIDTQALMVEGLHAARSRLGASNQDMCKLGHFNSLHVDGSISFESSNSQLVMPSCDSESARQPLTYFPPTEALAVLISAAQGRGVLFSGDSMMRQLFLRIVALLRGQEDLIGDHYFHQDGLFVIYTDGRDDLIVLDDKGRSSAAHVLSSHFSSSGSHDKSSGGDVVLAMMFQWETKPSVHRKDFERIDPPLHIAAFMYWWSNRDSQADIEPYIKRVNARGHSISDDNRNVKRRYVYVTTPWTAPKTFGGVDDSNRLPRNERAANWILGRGAAANKNAADADERNMARREGALEMLLLDFAGLANSKPFPKTKDGIHYMCIWTPKFPEKTNNQKFNSNGDCRDPMNLGVAQWLLHTLLASSSSSSSDSE